MNALSPVISATLIVRDEEKFLSECLDSLTGFADEIVVVDTGSVDRTREIAVDHGARCYDFPWCDDFSAARNVAIEHARGEWLLYIDADERVRPSDFEGLRQRLADPRMLGATVRFHPRTGATAYREYRLFRRRPDVRFQGAMHESFLPSLRSALKREGGYIGDVDLVIDHVGYDGDQTHKLPRNLKLLEKQIEDTPGRVYLWWHLGTVYRDLDRMEEAEAAWRRGAFLADRQRGAHAEDSLCFIELARMDPLLGAPSLAWIDQGLSLRPENLMLHWLRARALMDIEPDEAEQVFERLSAIDPDAHVSETSYDRRLFGAGALSDVGYCAFKRGDFAKAAEAYAGAAMKDPQSLEYRLKHALAASRVQ